MPEEIEEMMDEEETVVLSEEKTAIQLMHSIINRIVFLPKHTPLKVHMIVYESTVYFRLYERVQARNLMTGEYGFTDNPIKGWTCRLQGFLPNRINLPRAVAKQLHKSFPYKIEINNVQESYINLTRIN